MHKGDFVRINYVGRLESGEIFDLTYEEVAKKEKVFSEKMRYGPIPVVVGAGFVIPGLDRALLDMEIGSKKNVEVQPKDGFGERDAKLVQIVPQKVFRDQKMEPKHGLIVDFGNMRGRIQSVSSGRVRVDFNNPLAGKVLVYELEVVSKIEDKVEQIKSVFEFFGFRPPSAELKGGEVIVDVSLPPELKQRFSTIILENVNGIEKVTYRESFGRKESKDKTTS